MDKAAVISLSNSTIRGNVDMQLALQCITDYCREKGKNDDDIAKFMQAFSIMPVNYYLDTALSYFKRKFNVCTVSISTNGFLTPLYSY